MASNDDKSAVWIKKRVEPSSVDENFKDGFVDMLTERRRPFNDLVWVMKKAPSPEQPAYKYKHERNYEKLNNDVLHSDRVTHVVEQVQ